MNAGYDVTNHCIPFYLPFYLHLISSSLLKFLFSYGVMEFSLSGAQPLVGPNINQS